jgi:REP element-mobilizing transposase RayT
MPRKARIDAPGALHHIIIRGIERRYIFKDSLDYQNFFERLDSILSETETPCFAWALMPNHIHLLMRTGYVSISSIMRRLLTGYAQQFNRRHRRHGQLFQNRFKSILCEEEIYFLELVRYIHLNPLRGKIVENLKQLKRYPYGGHSVIMSAFEHSWHDKDYVLKMFAAKEGAARKYYEQFVAKGIATGRRPDLVGGGLIRSAGGWSALKALRSGASRIMGDERILGSSHFVEEVLKRANEDYEQQTLAERRGLDFDLIIREVANHFGIEQRLLKSASKQRQASQSKSIVCFLAAERLKMKGREVARRLQITPSAVSKAIIRGRSDPISDKIWQKVVKNTSLEKLSR